MSKYRAHVGFPLETNAANENRSHHRGPPYDHLVVEDRQREREILSDSACFAAPCLLLRGLLFSRVSVVRLLVPASPSPPSSFYISISPFVLLGRV